MVLIRVPVAEAATISTRQANPEMRDNDESESAMHANGDDALDYLAQPELGLCPMVFWHVSFVWNHVAAGARQFAADIGLIDIIDRMARKAVQHPFITLALATTVLSMGLPLLVITLFALATVAVTFTGFVVLEGTLISISSVLLFGCMGAMLVVSLFFAGVALAGYFGFLHIYDLYRGMRNRK